MTGLMRPDTLRDRILGWATEEIKAGALPIKSDTVMRALLYHGELQRAEIPVILGLGERAARRATSALIESGALASDSSRAPVRLVFPATLAERWMPGLFPDT